MPVQWAATTHPGIRRTSNEDTYCSRPDLGLFIVATTAKQHGGRAFAESEGVGRGATFTLELPSAPSAPS